MSMGQEDMKMPEISPVNEAAAAAETIPTIGKE